MKTTTDYHINRGFSRIEVKEPLYGGNARDRI